MNQALKKRKKQVSGLTLKQEEGIENALSKALGVNAKIKRPGKLFQGALDALKLDFGKLQSKVDRAFELGRKDNFDDITIGRYIREAMRDDYSDRTIRNVLPDSAKHKEMIRENTKFAENTSANEHETSKQEQTQTQEDKVETTDKYRLYQDIIAAKVKLLKQKDEEIAGLRKRIVDLEAEVKRLKK